MSYPYPALLLPGGTETPSVPVKQYTCCRVAEKMDGQQEHHAPDCPTAHPPPSTAQLPPEIWKIVFDSLADPSDPNIAPTLASLTRVCHFFREEGEAALYRDVSVGPSISQVRKFLETVGGDRERASTMRSLRLDIPDVAYGVPPLPAAARSFIGDTARHPNVTPVDIGTIQALRPSMESMFRHAVNLVDLRFPALEDFPGILHGATFRLWSLTTTGMAFGVLHQWENSVAPARDSNCYSMYSPVEKLRSLRILDLDLKGIWCSAKSLHTTFCQYHITHLTLRGTADRTLADELLPLMAERLVSFKLVLAARDQEFCPWTDIWPTQILGKAELPFLKHFELDESAISYQGHPSQQAFIPFDNSWKAACPVIQTFVWRPSAYHLQLFRVGGTSRSRFHDALPGYNAALFAGWPSLERFERPKLEMGLDSYATCVAYTRGEREGLVEEVTEFSEDLWRRV